MASGEVTPRAAARALGMNVKTVRALCDQGKLDHRVVRGPRRRRIYIPVSEIRRLKIGQKQRKKLNRKDRLDQPHARQNR